MGGKMVKKYYSYFIGWCVMRVNLGLFFLDDNWVRKDVGWGV